MLQVQVEHGGSRVAGNLQPGGWARERELKDMHKGALHCDVCKSLKAYGAGKLTAEQALARSGWGRATAHERSLLLDIFGLQAAPDKVPERAPDHAPAPAEPAPEPTPPATAAPTIPPEIDALAGALIAGWSPKAGAEHEPEAQAQAAEPRPEAEPELEASA